MQEEPLVWCEDKRGRFLAFPPWQSQLQHGFFGSSFDARGSDQWQAKFDFPVAMMKQVHGTVIKKLSDPDELEGDAWVLDLQNEAEQGVGVGLLTADCAPVLFYAPQRNLLAAAHCGWRGAVDRLLPDVISVLENLGAQTSEIEVCIGPSAQGCCYEVGDEVIEKVLENCAEARSLGVLQVREGKTYCEISSLLSYQAMESGLGSRNVHPSKKCTICDSSFFSYRREKALAGRQLSFIGPKFV